MSPRGRDIELQELALSSVVGPWFGKEDQGKKFPNL